MNVRLALTALATIGVVAGHWLAFDFAPVEAQMGVVQKIFYFHVPSAMACYAGFIACCAGSLAYLWTRKGRWDALALAGAELGLIFGLIVLITGPLWARPAWGVWWKWEPRLTSMALLVLMFSAYWVLHTFGGTGEGVRRFAAALAVFATPNIYFVHVAVEKWKGMHPEIQNKSSGGLSPDMRTAFIVCMVVLLLLFGLLLEQRYRMHLQSRLVAALRRRIHRIGGDA